MMTLADFFKNAPFARPVAPRPIKFTLVSCAEVLPGGAPNPHRQQVAATAEAALVFMGGDGALQTRIAARKYVTEKYPESQGQGEEYFLELTYQIATRVLHEWDAAERRVGGPFFPSVEVARELLEAPEANRIVVAYNKYVADEHPEGGPQDAATFQKPGQTG